MCGSQVELVPELQLEELLLQPHQVVDRPHLQLPLPEVELTDVDMLTMEAQFL